MFCRLVRDTLRDSLFRWFRRLSEEEVVEKVAAAVVVAEAAAAVVAEAAAGIVAEEGVSATAGWVAEEVSRYMCPPPMLCPRRTGIRQTACFVQGTHPIQKLKESTSPE